MPRHIGHDQHDRFPTDPSGLPEAGGPELLELAAGDTLELRVEPWQRAAGRADGADAGL